MSEIEFKITPEIVDNFISGIKIQPDPLVLGQQIESCISDLAIYYSSCPKLTNSLVYNYKTSQVQNKYSVVQRE